KVRRARTQRLLQLRNQRVFFFSGRWHSREGFCQNHPAQTRIGWLLGVNARLDQHIAKIGATRRNERIHRLVTGSTFSWEINCLHPSEEFAVGRTMFRRANAGRLPTAEW